MTFQELSEAAMERRLPDNAKWKVGHALDHNWGCALYRDGQGFDYVVSYGRGGDLGYTYPPANYGSASLVAYVRPPGVEQEMVSPLVKGLRDRDPQIHRPRPQPSHTVYPDIRH
jgi:hypothetical protein